jgi:hypothetical protein
VSYRLGSGREVLQTIQSHLRNEEEQLTLALSWVYDLHLCEIQAYCPDLFADTSYVYQVKRNVMNRLMRDPIVQRLRESIT